MEWATSDGQEAAIYPRLSLAKTRFGRKMLLDRGYLDLWAHGDGLVTVFLTKGPRTKSKPIKKVNWGGSNGTGFSLGYRRLLDFRA